MFFIYLRLTIIVMIKKILFNILIFFSLSSVGQKDSLYTAKSIFNGHLLTPIHNDPIFNNYELLIWPIIVIFISLVIFVSVRVSDSKKISELVISPFSIQVSKQLFREDYKLNKRIPLFLSINFILLISFLIYETNRYFNNALFTEYGSFAQFVLFILIVFTVYLIKFLVTNFLFLFLSISELGKEYLFNVLVYSHTLSIILFPFIILLHFSRIPAYFILYPALILSIGFYLLRLIRTLIISYSEQNIGIVQIFMYFCTLEILPLLVLIKFLLINF